MRNCCYEQTANVGETPGNTMMARRVAFFSVDIMQSDGTENVSIMITNKLVRDTHFSISFISLFEESLRPFFDIDKRIDRYTVYKQSTHGFQHYWNTVIRLKHLVMQHGIKLLIDTDGILDMYSPPVKYSTGIRVIAWEYFNYLQNPGVLYRKLTRRWAVRAADAGKSMFSADDFTVARNAINVDSYTFNEACRECTRNSLRFFSDTFMVGHVGRFVPAKNHVFVLDVFFSLLRLRPNSVLLLVGDGGLRSKNECRAADLGISEFVRFPGLRPDVPNIMQAMDVFLMLSLCVGLPLVLIEAHAAGLPYVISGSIPEDCDLAGSYITRIVQEEEPVKWAKLLMAQPESSKRGNGSSAECAAGFDVTDETKQLEKFYLKRAEVKI